MFPKLWMLCASLAGGRRTIPAPPTMFAAVRCGLCTLALIAFVPSDASAGKVHEFEIDSEHLFGFTIGSDIGERGEKEIENETNARAGKNGGSYTAIRQNTQLRRTFASCGSQRSVSPERWPCRSGRECSSVARLLTIICMMASASIALPDARFLWVRRCTRGCRSIGGRHWHGTYKWQDMRQTSRAHSIL